MSMRSSRLLLLSTLSVATLTLAACSGEGDDGASGDGSGGSSGGDGNGTAARSFNECGVAAPLPAETGQCTAIASPVIADFEDFSGTDASSYTFSVGAKPPAEALRGAILHVGDGSDANGGDSVITTEMVTGEGDTGYALRISNTNAMNWGGLLMFYFPFGGATSACMDARDFLRGIELSVRGNSPSQRFGVTLGMLDTIPTADQGLCSNPTSTDCKDATLEFELEDPEAWTQIQVPWSGFTPGVGTGASCIPVTGQNIARLVIQPFMDYPPPDYMFEPGAYQMSVDNVRFY